MLARSLNPDFRVVHRYGIPLVVRVANKFEQVVLPKGQGFRQLLLEECHTSPVAGHLGSQKVVNLLIQRVWWPKLRATIGEFCRQCDTCARIKDSTGKPHGAM